MTDPALRRVLRRETHSPRTAAMAVVVVVLLLVAVYAGVELVLWLAGRPPLLVAPGPAAAWLVSLPTLQPAGAIAAGAGALALIGLILVVLGIAPGRLAKHRMDDGDRAVVVDNGVVAASLAQHLSTELGIARSDVVVGIGHRRADVTVRVPADVVLEGDEVRDLAAGELDRYRLDPPVRPRVRLALVRTHEEDR